MTEERPEDSGPKPILEIVARSTPKPPSKPLQQRLLDHAQAGGAPGGHVSRHHALPSG
jgi:hypothetical protein